MPNWCENQLRILGSNEDIQTFANETLALNEDGTHFLLFDNIIPQPEHIRDGVTEGSVMPDWWNWRVSNWGTKWEISNDQTCQVREGEIYIAFDTAWAPPSPVIQRIAEDNPHLTIAHSYDEPGMDFGGYVIFADGKVTDFQEGGSRSSTWHDQADWTL